MFLRALSSVAGKGVPIRLGTRIVSRSYISIDDIFTSESTTGGSTNFQPSKIHAPYPLSRKEKGRFVSPFPGQVSKKATDVFKLLTQRDKSLIKFSKEVDRVKLLQPVEVDKKMLESTDKSHISWMGHASCYLQTDGMYFLTDPVWSSRASPLSFAGPKRYIEPAIELEDLKIDVVLLSHTHYDHLDADSAKRIGNRAHW
jgi:hypothetical protein